MSRDRRAFLGAAAGLGAAVFAPAAPAEDRPRARGRALLVGLNRLSEKHYGDWTGELKGPESDVEDMAKIVDKRFAVTKLVTEDATRPAVLDGLKAAAADLRAGDLFLLYYSGHGGRVLDQNEDAVITGLDDTWCLYDAQLVDDELDAALAAFLPGVRVLLIADTCHLNMPRIRGGSVPQIASGANPRLIRAMPLGRDTEVYKQHKDFYDNLTETRKALPRPPVRASVLQLHACQFNQAALDGPRNGEFTSALKIIYDRGNFRMGYDVFHQRIQVDMPATQSPRLAWAGAYDPDFLALPPFVITKG